MADLPWYKYFPTLFDADTVLCSNQAVGGWQRLLNHMNPKNIETIEGDFEYFAKILRCQIDEAKEIIHELKAEDVCDIHIKNPTGYEIVTLTSRFIKKKNTKKENNKIRKQKQRMSRSGHANVTPNVTGERLEVRGYIKKDLKEKKNTKKKVELTAQQQERFNQFWEIWPNKKSKGEAEKAWATIEPDNELLAKILAKIKEGNNSLDWAPDEKGKRYISHPATWLRAKGWEDEYTPLKKAKSPARGYPDSHPPPDPEPLKSKCPEAEKIWDAALVQIEGNVSQEDFDTWFAATVGCDLKPDGTLIIAVPDQLHANWLKDHYSELINEVLQGREFELVAG